MCTVLAIHTSQRKGEEMIKGYNGSFTRKVLQRVLWKLYTAIGK